jgi:hypothetical protein
MPAHFIKSEDLHDVLTCSPAFADLFLGLWLAEDRRDESGKLVYRMVEYSIDEGCPIIDLATEILYGERSMETFLAQCSTARQRNLFCVAVMDRVARGWGSNKISPVGWIRSLNQLASTVYHLCKEHDGFFRNLRRIEYLMQTSLELNAFSKVMANEPQLHSLAAHLVSSLLNLSQLASDKRNCHSHIRRNWRHLHKGCFDEALFRATMVLRNDEQGGCIFGCISPILDEFRFISGLSKYVRLL